MITEHGTEAPGIAIVRSARGWAKTLHRYVVDHGGAIVRTRPLEERQALEDDYEILIVDDISSFLTSHIVEELHRRGRRVLGVYDPDEHSGSENDTGKKRLVRLGVDAVIEAQAAPEAFVRVIHDLAPAPSERALQVNENDLSELHAGAAELLARSGGRSTAGTDIVVPPSKDRGKGRRGNITTVIGAAGGTGTTEIAIEVARSLGRRGERAVVLDGDEMAPAIAQRLNLALHPNIRTAVDVVEHGTGRLSECLTSVASNLEVITGLPHPRDWVEMRGTDMSALLGELTRGRPQIVVNASSSLEDLGSYGGSDRHALTRAAVMSADTVVAVCLPTPVGVRRLLDRVAELVDLVDDKPLHIVVNRTQKGAFKRKEVAREIQRSFSPAGIHFVPADPRVERSSWEGTLVPQGEFTKAITASLTPMLPKAALSAARRRGQTPARQRNR